MAQQVVILYALTHGFIDHVPVPDVLRFERELFEFIENTHPDLFLSIQRTKELPEQEEIESVLNEFKELFSVTQDNQTTTQQES